jgi:hypothetical protein
MSPVPALLPTPSDIERLIDRLPAERRARFHWAPERFRRILDRLLVGKVTPEVIQRATAEFVQAWGSLAGDLQSGLSEVMPGLEQSLLKLMSYFQGLPAAEGIEWTLGVLKNASRDTSQVNPKHMTVLTGIDDPMSLLEAQIILLAVLQAAERGIPPERLEELAETAYLEASEWVHLKATQGIDLDPLNSLTPEQRFAKLLRYLDDLRKILTPEDLAVMSQARRTSPLF